MADVIRPIGWPRPSGYSDGMQARGRVIVTSGMIGWDPVTQRLVDGGLAAQAEQALRNVRQVVESGGGQATDLVRLTWFITDRDAYVAARAEMGRVWRGVMGAHYPAMSVIFVRALLEPGAVVEIEATAVVAE
jgi:enamine deaminase RidA (YjgF/YER057c/UK114 family)